MITIQLPPWAFSVSLFIAENRVRRFSNRFRSQKLRHLHRSESYSDHTESIIGYLGDIGAALLLGQDPIQMLENMILATDGLAHRDQFDLSHNGYHIDAKVEDYGPFHREVLCGLRGPTQTYGNRLINSAQWEENHGSTDIYLFGCFDPPLAEGNLLHQLRSICWVGYATSDEVAAAPSSDHVPAGPRLPMRAKIIPHQNLNPVESLFRLPPLARLVNEELTQSPNDVAARRITDIIAGIRGIATGS